VVAASIVSFGAAGIIAGAVGTAAFATTAAATSLASAILVAGSAAAGAVVGAVVTTVVATVQESVQAIIRIGEKKKLNGRQTKAPSGYKIEEESNSRTLVEDFEDRIIIKDSTKNKVQAILCPDYSVN
jgi:hypothetical protein